MSYSVNEAAKLVGKNPRKIKLDIRQGKLEASRLGDKPNSAYRIEYKDLRRTYSTSFEPQPSGGDGVQMSGVQAEAVQSATQGTPQLAASADTSVAGAHGEDEVLEDEPQILRAALAREVRNNRIIQKTADRRGPTYRTVTKWSGWAGQYQHAPFDVGAAHAAK